MYYARYWRIPLEGTPENSDHIEHLYLHFLNNKYDDTQVDYYIVNSEITAEKATAVPLQMECKRPTNQTT